MTSGRRLPRAEALVNIPLRSSTDPDTTRRYARDETLLMTAGAPDAVVRPETTEEVQELLRWAHEHRVAVLPRGGGTGLTGAAVAPAGCVVLSTERLNRIREVTPDERVAVAEAGVINAELNQACAPHGLMWAPDPASWTTSTVGGNASTNAGGLRCLRYGATRANVLGLEAVLPDGRRLHTGGRTVKRSAGYDLTQLFIGSEGTLGVITAVVAKLQPTPPPQLTALATFAAAHDAAAAAATLTRESVVMTMIELLDRPMVDALEAYRSIGFGSSVGAVLLVQADDTSLAAAALNSAFASTCASDVAMSSDPAEADLLLDIRRSTYPALRQLGTLLVEDVAVPPSRLPELLTAVDAAAARHDITIATVAHAGEGNAHPTLVLNDEPHVEQRAWAAASDIFRSAQNLGGTISGEHGIGRLKREWLAAEIGDVSLDVHRTLKEALDPHNIMNPGAVFEVGTDDRSAR
jgi:glycolate oxidase